MESPPLSLSIIFLISSTNTWLRVRQFCYSLLHKKQHFNWSNHCVTELPQSIFTTMAHFTPSSSLYSPPSGGSSLSNHTPHRQQRKSCLWILREIDWTFSTEGTHPPVLTRSFGERAPIIFIICLLKFVEPMYELWECQLADTSQSLPESWDTLSFCSRVDSNPSKLCWVNESKWCATCYCSLWGLLNSYPSHPWYIEST